MKIVIAPDKFRRSLTGIEFCWIVKEAIWEVLPDVEFVEAPVADGGDGTLAALEAQVPHGKKMIEVHDPLFRKIKAPSILDATDNFTRLRIDLKGITAEVYARKGEHIRTRKHSF